MLLIPPAIRIIKPDTPQDDLFQNDAQRFAPLAERMRPQSLADYIGQDHILGKDKPLYQAIQQDRLHSMVFWGPPGTGKTTLAKIIAKQCQAQFISLSAVLSGVKDIRDAVQQAGQTSARTVLFIDEVHRFNKAQQDAFLPHVESGQIFFIGATTENPSFELNNALLSRVRTYVLKSLTETAINQLLKRALTDEANGLGKKQMTAADETLQIFSHAADGDARRALNLLEIATDTLPDQTELKVDHAKEICKQGLRRFDKQGDLFYEQISALHKSVRGSDPDAALYWLCRMLDGGCDPLYIVRRVVRMASEDIGNADPRGLALALNAWDVQTRLGSPEGELTLAQAVIYLACAAKSNATYVAYKAAMAYVQANPSADVPEHLRNAPTQLMKDLGYGKDYDYAHNHANAFSAEQSYFPEGLEAQEFYQPVERGLEIQIKEKLAQLKKLRRK